MKTLIFLCASVTLGLAKPTILSLSPIQYVGLHGGPVSLAVAPPVSLPEPVKDTPEVAKARAEHLAAVEAASSASSNAEDETDTSAAAPSSALPQPVQDTPEVAQARSEHLAAVERAKIAAAAAPVDVSLSTVIWPGAVPLSAAHPGISLIAPQSLGAISLPAVSRTIIW